MFDFKHTAVLTNIINDREGNVHFPKFTVESKGNIIQDNDLFKVVHYGCTMEITNPDYIGDKRHKMSPREKKTYKLSRSKMEDIYKIIDLDISKSQLKKMNMEELSSYILRQQEASKSIKGRLIKTFNKYHLPPDVIKHIASKAKLEGVVSWVLF